MTRPFPYNLHHNLHKIAFCLQVKVRSWVGYTITTPCFTMCTLLTMAQGGNKLGIVPIKMPTTSCSLRSPLTVKCLSTCIYSNALLTPQKLQNCFTHWKTGHNQTIFRAHNGNYHANTIRILVLKSQCEVVRICTASEKCPSFAENQQNQATMKSKAPSGSSGCA